METSKDYERKLEDLIFAIKQAKNRGCNVNLLIGAGCSVTGGIPLANKIVEDLKEKYPYEMCRVIEDTYAECMSKLTPIERRLFISNYVKNSKVNWAHLCIALLMKENYINRVLTTNFDNLLPRACAMVCEFPGIYDLALTASEFRPDLLWDKSIIYLHGQHTGFILCNTKDEVKAQKDNIKNIFKELNKNSLWIIVGYSGNNDAILQLFIEEKTFENRLYWVGYKDNEPSNLLKESLLSSKNYAFYIKGYDADSFFISLASYFGLFPPYFIKEPFTYTKETLNEIVTSMDENLVVSETKNLLPYTFKILDKAINEIENDVNLIAELYVKNLNYYSDNFIDFMNKIEDSTKEDEDVENLHQTVSKILDEEISESIKQLNKYIYQIDEIIKHNENDLNIVPLTRRILEKINICMFKYNEKENDYYLESAIKYFEICEKIDPYNSKLINLMAKIYNKYYKLSKSSEKNEYLLKSLELYISVVNKEYNKESLIGIIEVINNIITSNMEVQIKLEKIETVISTITKNDLIPDLDKKINKAIIVSEYVSIINNTKEKIELLNNSIIDIEKIYQNDKSKRYFLDLLIELNSKCLELLKDNLEYYKSQYVETLDKIIALLKTKKNFSPNDINNILEYLHYLIEKFSFLVNEDSNINELTEISKLIMDNVKMIININCTNKEDSYDDSISELLSKFIYQDKMNIEIMDLIKKEYINFLSNNLEFEKDIYARRLANFNNKLCYCLINNTNYTNSSFQKFIFDFTKEVINFSLSRVTDNYLIATKGFWYFKNIFLDSNISEEEGYKLYQKSIELCTAEEKLAFEQKLYLELSKFYYYRLSKIEEAIIYCNKGIEIGEVSGFEFIYNELSKLTKLLDSNQEAILSV